MCSSVNGLMKLHLASSHSQSSNLTLSNEDDLVEWCFTIPFLARVVTYIAVLALIAIVIFMVMKYLEELDEERSTGVEGAAAETSRLWPGKTVRFTYGTCEQDLESGVCTGTSFSSSSGSGESSSTSSPEDLYDKKLCVICYDEQRNCFFVPCGHCATCYVCAQRIFNGENKTCPVCRRFIGKVRKLLAP